MQRFEKSAPRRGNNKYNDVGAGIKCVMSRGGQCHWSKMRDSKSRSCPRGRHHLTYLSKDSGFRLGEVGAMRRFGAGAWHDLT